jgi:hypothetical protein
VGVVVLAVVVGLFVLLVLFTFGRLAWQLWQGEQIESTSQGKQYFGRRRRDDPGE